MKNSRFLLFLLLLYSMVTYDNNRAVLLYLYLKKYFIFLQEEEFSRIRAMKAEHLEELERNKTLMAAGLNQTSS